MTKYSDYYYYTNHIIVSQNLQQKCDLKAALFFKTLLKDKETSSTKHHKTLSNNEFNKEIMKSDTNIYIVCCY